MQLLPARRLYNHIGVLVHVPSDLARIALFRSALPSRTVQDYERGDELPAPDILGQGHEHSPKDLEVVDRDRFRDGRCWAPSSGREH